MGISNLTSSIRGASGQEEIYNIKKLQGDNLEVSNARVGTTVNNITMSASGVVKYVGQGGQLYGEIFAYDRGWTATILSSGIGSKIQVRAFDQDGLSKGTTPDASNAHITINTAGHYTCNVKLHIASGSGSGFELGVAVFKNNGASILENCHGHRNLSGGGGDVGSVSIGGIANFNTSDTVEVWIWNENNSDDAVIDDITLSLVQIGGN